MNWFGQSQAVRKLGPKGRHDPWLLLAITGLVTFGIVMVASSSIAVADGQHIGEFYYLKRHLIFLAVGGAFFGVLGWMMRGSPLVPVRDPRLSESLSFENV